ncbi:MAG TPA: hypothetical protein VFE51_30320 [Verrucomicrobiae bacterium]|nr:hypothetical protein [Verrucomicrobiae bacterium]
MKKPIAGFLVGTAALLAGCIVTSVHPFYTAKDVSYDPAFLGQWTNTQSPERWTFTKEGDNSYQLTYFSGTAGEKTNVARACLFKVNDARFLDFMGKDQDCDVMPPAIPSHFLLRVFQVTPTLKMAALNHDWLRTVLDNNPKLLRHEMLGEKDDRRVVLTASTAELQEFLTKNLGTDEAWKDSFELKRQQTP